MIRHIVLASVSVVALTAAANAADMYGPAGGYKDEFVPASIWTGFYAGVNGGYGWSAGDATLSGSAQLCAPKSPATTCSSSTSTGGTVTPGSGTNTFGSDGEFAGGQIGYNLQPAGSHYVLGVEADIQGSGIKGSSNLNLAAPQADFYGTSELDWFGTVRGRVGFTFDRSLIYATGGVAFGGVKDSLTVAAGSNATLPNPVTATKSATETGYVVGAGIEHYILPGWSVKAEYQYIDLGSDKIPSTTAGTPGTYNTYASGSLNAEHAYETVRIGLNYHILPNFEPLK